MKCLKISVICLLFLLFIFARYLACATPLVLTYDLCSINTATFFPSKNPPDYVEYVFYSSGFRGGREYHFSVYIVNTSGAPQEEKVKSTCWADGVVAVKAKNEIMGKKVKLMAISPEDEAILRGPISSMMRVAYSRKKYSAFLCFAIAWRRLFFIPLTWSHFRECC